ncbi:MAG: HD domain-containing protein [Anaerolineae bacterium]|nr:HD domain-containing protein [Anaerolineae bacterium]
MSELVEVSLKELVFSLANLIDHAITPLMDHHRRTAIIVYHLANQMDLPWKQRHDLLFSAAIHDIGAFSIVEQRALTDLKFEYEYINRHARAAYLLFNEIPYFKHIAEILRYHHAYLNLISAEERKNIPLEAFILQVADYAAVLSEKGSDLLEQAPVILAEIKKQSNSRLLPEVVMAFEQLAQKESFWLDIKSISLNVLFEKYIKLDCLHIKNDEILSLAHLFRRIIDFRSEFTSTHTAGVASVAGELAELSGRDDEAIRKIFLAGYLHDIGKLTVPNEILEKPGKLTPEEFNVIRGHTYYTKMFLDGFSLFAGISDWASQHHEKMSGKGYPFHEEAKNLSVESRTVAVADVFTALTEDRPYRKGMSTEAALQIMDEAVRDNELDGSLVDLIRRYQDKINQVRITAQQTSKKEYDKFITELNVDGF